MRRLLQGTRCNVILKGNKISWITYSEEFYKFWKLDVTVQEHLNNLGYFMGQLRKVFEQFVIYDVCR